MTATPERLMRKRVGRLWPAVLGVVTVLLAGTVVAMWPRAAGPTTSDSAGRTLTVATWNMCGVARWSCAGTGSRTAKRDAAAQLATAGGARVVFLQEACASDVSAVRDRLGGSWRSVFRAYTWRGASGHISTVPCATGGKEPAGFAVLSATRLSDARGVPSRQPTLGLRRGILCAVVAEDALTVCAAHLSRPGDDRAHPQWELRDDQLRALAAAAPGDRVVYGGDLNVDPPDLGAPDGVWPPGPYGSDRECDQASAGKRSGRPTHVSGHKLDYLFTGLSRERCSVRDTGVSDHYALLLTVRAD
ncbi:endonuclease/exonuclease/phosphatase family protein [Streptomyces sp. NPDC048243]|uniref:endonuclease/exonuclease/phosphatase family protein n=1 Tax=Streptomyces sp. NPDC048243 TaxID=3365522 RepID=UPI00371F690C